MTNTELLNIHFNNSDLNLTNLAAINNSSVAVVRSILVEYYGSDLAVDQFFRSL